MCTRRTLTGVGNPEITSWIREACWVLVNGVTAELPSGREPDFRFADIPGLRQKHILKHKVELEQVMRKAMAVVAAPGLIAGV